MIGLTVGVGPGWKECAEEAAGRMSAHTGLECRVIDRWPSKPLDKAYWVKLWVQQFCPTDDILFFDADLLCQHDWDPQEHLEGCDFAWVPDPSPQVPGECAFYGLESRLYGNSGLFLIRKDCPLLKRAQRMYPGCGRWPEQTALNMAVQVSRDLRINTLPSKYNHLVRKHQHDAAFDGRYGKITSLHFVGLRGNAEELASIQEKLRCTSNA